MPINPRVSTHWEEKSCPTRVSPTKQITGSFDATEDFTPDFTPDCLELIRLFQSLSAKGQGELLAAARDLSSRQRL